jgi:hypothetical protein
MAQADSPVSPDGVSPSAVSISVFFPCYNEQDNVRRVAEQAIRVRDGVGAADEVIIGATARPFCRGFAPRARSWSSIPTATASSTSARCRLCCL